MAGGAAVSTDIGGGVGTDIGVGVGTDIGAGVWASSGVARQATSAAAVRRVDLRTWSSIKTVQHRLIRIDE